jgi:hypothetical protein
MVRTVGGKELNALAAFLFVPGDTRSARRPPGTEHCASANKRVIPAPLAQHAFPEAALSGSETVRLSGITSNTSGLKSFRTNNVWKQVPPRRIGLFDKFNFPISPPPLHGTLALRCNGSIVVLFEIDEAVHSVLARKSVDHAFAMFPCPPS